MDRLIIIIIIVIVFVCSVTHIIREMEERITQEIYPYSPKSATSVLTLCVRLSTIVSRYRNLLNYTINS